MGRFVGGAVVAAMMLGAALVSAPTGAHAAVQDGNWSVLIITESGACDAAYRYPVTIANGRINYAGNVAIDLTGTVSPSGAVKVNIRMGEKGANGTGRLSGSAGSGTWQGAAANNTCAGRWEAERR